MILQFFKNNYYSVDKDNRLQKKVGRIIYEAKKLKDLKDDELLQKVQLLRLRVLDESITEEWYALVQEISFRVLNLRHYEMQILAGIILNEGKITEMATGEGKTLASTLAISLNALNGKGVHVVTVNDYLAQRDAKYMGKLYKQLGLSTGLVLRSQDLSEKKQNYAMDITYVTNSTVVFDYLEDNRVFKEQDIAQRGLSYCVIDEIDSILVDDAKTPLILSSAEELSYDIVKNCKIAKALAESFIKDEDFELSIRSKSIFLSTGAYLKIEKIAPKEKTGDAMSPLIPYILNALQAKYFYRKNKDYIVDETKIILVDQSTGRLLPDRNLSYNMQEALETKEGLPLSDSSKTDVSITYQRFFPLYKKIAGMTGTAQALKQEFKKIYNLDVVSIPTTKPMIRQDFSDEIYRTEVEKCEKVKKLVKNAYECGQPVLLCASSIEKSELFSDLLASEAIPHTLLNALPRQALSESKIVAQAGESHSITIATNMAGRGTDIILGGNLEFQIKERIFQLFTEFGHTEDFLKYQYFLKSVGSKRAIRFSLFSLLTFRDEIFFLNDLSSRKIRKITKELKRFPVKKKHWKLRLYLLVERIFSDYPDLLIAIDHVENLPYSLDIAKPSLQSLYKYFFKIKQNIFLQKKQQVIQKGGLFVIGTERSASTRVDDQLRGRAGRQGDPGKSQFILSLDDELFQDYINPRFQKVVQNLQTTIEENAPLVSGFVNKSVRTFQRRIEENDYQQRTTLFQYDEVPELQRKNIFLLRSFFLKTPSFNSAFLFILIQTLVNFLTTPRNQEIAFQYLESFEISSSLLNSFLNAFKKNDYRQKNISVFFEYFLQCQRSEQDNLLFLNSLDSLWSHQLEVNQFLQEASRAQIYNQRNPVEEFNQQSLNQFNKIFFIFAFSVLYYFYFQFFPLSAFRDDIFLSAETNQDFSISL